MSIAAIAWRNVSRNGRRSLLTVLASAVGAMAILLFGGYVKDNELGLQVVTVRSHGHLQVVAKDFLDFGSSNPGLFSIHGYEPLIDKIRDDSVLGPMVELVTPVLQVEGVAGNFAAGSSSHFSGEGVVPSEYQTQLAWDGFGTGIPPATSALSDDVADGGVVGFRLAQLLSLCDPLGLSNCRRLAPRAQPEASSAPLPTDIAALAEPVEGSEPEPNKTGRAAIELLASSPGGLPNVVRMDVVAAQRQAVRQVDSIHVAMPLRLAQRLVFGPDERAASAILVQLRTTDMLPAAQRRLKELVSGSQQALEVLTFHEMSPVYDQILANYASIFQFIAVLMAVISLFSIINAVNMAIGERIGEIGTLRALGFQRRTIRRIFVLEGAILGVIGAVVGAATAIVMAVIINGSALSWTPPGRTDAIPLRVDILASPSIVVATVLGLSLVACLSALWPANHAARLEVTEALRHA